MNLFERLLEGALWRSRFVVLFAVIASMAAAFANFYMAGAVALIGLALYSPTPPTAGMARRKPVATMARAMGTDYRAAWSQCATALMGDCRSCSNA